MIATDATSLGKQAGQYDAISGPMLAKWAIIWLLQQIAGNTMNAQQLITQAQAYQAISGPMLADWTIIYLLTQISISNGGSPNGVTSGNYGGGQPNFTPVSGTAIAIDTSNGRQWAYWAGAWH
jgi:hypothetical protein